MKLSLNTYSIGSELTLTELVELLPALGFDGVEFRCEDGQRHGVELEALPEQRRAARALLREAGVEVACLATGQRYDSPDVQVRQRAVERTKRYLDLAADLGGGRIRVFGNDFPEGTPRAEVVQYAGECLGQLGRYAEGTGVDVLLEMHGEFNDPQYALGGVRVADHARVAINYNCDDRDVVGGSVAATLDQVWGYVRHIHMHDLEQGHYPYRELFGILKSRGYRGFVSLELAHPGGAVRKVIALYAALYHEMLAALE